MRKYIRVEDLQPGDVFVPQGPGVRYLVTEIVPGAQLVAVISSLQAVSVTGDAWSSERIHQIPRGDEVLRYKSANDFDD